MKSTVDIYGCATKLDDRKGKRDQSEMI